jgi:hypothetical protein
VTAANTIPQDEIVPEPEDCVGLPPLATSLLSVMQTYKDVLFTQQSHTNLNAIRKAYMVHVVNHLMQRHPKNAKKANNIHGDDNVTDGAASKAGACFIWIFIDTLIFEDPCPNFFYKFFF